MENSKKRLKTSSLIVLLFAVISMVSFGAETFLGASADGNADEFKITQIFVFVLATIMHIPEFYVGYKGLMVANSRPSSNLYIYVANIIFILTVVSVVSPIIGFFNGDDAVDCIQQLFELALRASIYFDFIKCTRAVSGGK